MSPEIDAAVQRASADLREAINATLLRINRDTAAKMREDAFRSLAEVEARHLRREIAAAADRLGRRMGV